jgi:hypothetical protein
MGVDTGSDGEPRVFFTAPWEPVVVRRGDALGLRALTDQFAEAIAPQLSNRVRDGRWVTILAWCLARSQEVFHASGGRSVASRVQQRERYAWLRPLELMWVARTIALAIDDWRDRTLSGQRRVRPWYEAYAEGKKPADRFGMSVDQFRAYRQTGMYGAYRIVFRKLPKMTVLGDGWTPGPAANELAKWLDGKLGEAGLPWPLHVGDGDDDSVSTRSAKLARGEEHRWWLRQWIAFNQGDESADTNTLPRRKDDFGVLAESGYLKPLVFGGDPSGKRRSEVAQEAAKASATDHPGICSHLSEVFSEDTTIALLERFSRLADAGMVVMDLIAGALLNDTHPKLADVAASVEAREVCEELYDAAREWPKHTGLQLRHVESAHRFAAAIPNAQPAECLRAVLQHHEVHGGGLRWFVLRDDRIEPRTPVRPGGGRYRFRLWSLCRLGTQCGVLPTMPAALRDEVELEDVEPEAADE